MNQNQKAESIILPPIATISVKPESPLDYMQRIREAGCYTGVRSLINLVCYIWCGFLALGIVGAVVSPAGGAVIFSAVALAAVGVSVGMALREGAIVVFDIADSLVEQNRRKG